MPCHATKYDASRVQPTLQLATFSTRAPLETHPIHQAFGPSLIISLMVYGLSLRPKAQRPDAQEQRRREAQRDGTARTSALQKCSYCSFFFKRARRGVQKHENRCPDNPDNIKERRSKRLEAKSANVSRRLEAVLSDIGTAPFAVPMNRDTASPRPSDDQGMDWVCDANGGDNAGVASWQDLEMDEQHEQGMRGFLGNELYADGWTIFKSRYSLDISSSPPVAREFDLNAPPEPPRPLQPGEVYIVYHPASGRAPEISSICGYNIEEFNAEICSLPLDNPPPHPNLPPWHPCESLDDFEWVEDWINDGYSSKKINSQIKLHCKQAAKRGIQPFHSFSSANDVHQTLANARAIANISKVRSHPLFYYLPSDLAVI